jgi:hypothetical protein
MTGAWGQAFLPDTPRFKYLLCLGIALLGVALKFWLIAEIEIPDATDDPHEYVLQILYPANGGLAYPPGTGWVGRLFYDLHFPFRLGMEAGFIFAVALVLRALLAWPSRSYLSLGLFLFAILNPNPTEEFSHLLSDQVWLVETMLGLPCIVLAMEKDRWQRWIFLALAVLLLGLTTLTRSTFVPLIVSLGFFVITSSLLLAAKLPSALNRNRLAQLFPVAWTLLFGVSLLYYGTCFYDSKRFGYFGVSAIDCREYRIFYTCLQSVGEAGNDTHFPIDEERRKLICQAGPTSAWFVGQIDNNQLYKQVGIDLYGKPDIPAGWFQFATMNAVLPASHGDFRKAYALIKVIEGEIALASHENRLKTRHVLPLPDSRLSVVIAALPGALQHVITASLYQPPTASFIQAGVGRKFESSEFSQALTRRVVHESPIREKAWGILCVLYSWFYILLAFYFYVASVAAFLVVGALKWNRKNDVPLAFLAQQLFTIFFVIHLLWYALFDASGLSVFTRYMLFQNVMLPLLIVYYLKALMQYVPKLFRQKA